MRALLITVPLLLIAGCAGAAGERPGAPAPADALPTGRTFVSTGVTQAGKPKPLVDGTSIRLQIFDDGRIGVQAGCNSAQGPARLDGDRLIVDDLATTEIGCDQALHEQDDWVTGFFRGRPTWRLDGDDLQLTGNDIEVTMVDNSVAQPARPLTGTKWMVDTLVSSGTSSSVPAGTAAFMTIAADGSVTGSTGCNQFSSAAKIDGNKITFDDPIMTKMACDGAAGALEADVLRVLAQPLTFRVDGTRLYLDAPDGSGLQLVA